LVLARDRFGIKPLFYFQDKTRFLFSSELGGIMVYDFEKTTDTTSLHSYLQLNYLPGEHSILKGVQKLHPGSCLTIKKGITSQNQWYILENQTSKSRNHTLSNPETLKP